MKKKSLKKNIVMVIAAIVLTFASLSHEQYVVKRTLTTELNDHIRPAWGFPFQYMYDSDVSSPLNKMSDDDTFKIFPFLGNIVVYYLGLYFVIKTKED